jgi:hypothetical protein
VQTEIPLYQVAYYGFKCINMRVETTGAALLIALNYQESGYLAVYNQANNTWTNQWFYNL